ncbi:MAG: cation:proton antiporter, partial [Anaerolineales bacterium]|nr:cation:proton antiporter [Anaerolineales bacterium]
MTHLSTLLLQVSVILLSARALGYLFKRIHQPQVIGEMVAGILLGSSVLGWMAPGLYQVLFPPDSLEGLEALSQIGLILFMFLIGLELDRSLLKGKGSSVAIISQAGVILPFVLGFLLGLYLYPRFSLPSVTPLQFGLFIAIAMSITAFPVLARILDERGIINTPLGSIAIASAAVNDVTGWFLLVIVVFLVRTSSLDNSLWITLAGILAFVLLMFTLVRRWLTRLMRMYEKRGRITQNILALVLVLVLLSSLVTERLGVHALFGAFLLGVLMPRDESFTNSLIQKLNDITVVLLLPIFFAYNGIRTDVGLLGSDLSWAFAILIVAVAVAGKLGGVSVAARLTGIGWRSAVSLGILMNTRGLMELVLLNIGLDIGVITPTVFTMMVIMTL